MKKRGILCVILAVCAALTVQTAAAGSAAETGGRASLLEAESGIYSDAIRWELDEQGVLKISPYYGEGEIPDGEGEIPDEPRRFEGGNRADYPWSAHADAVKSLVIENLVGNVGAYAFQGYENLESVELSADVEEIRENAFEGCAKLAALTLKSRTGEGDRSVIGLTRIGNNAFQDCTSLASLTAPASLTSVGPQAFMGCTGLTSLTGPASLASVEQQAFMGCTGLTSLSLSGSLDNVGEQAFMGCTALTAAAIGDALNSVGEGAFQDCEKLERLTLTGSLSGLGSSFLDGCSALKEVTLAGTEDHPLSVPSGTPFRNCAALETLTLTGPCSGLPESTFAFVNDEGHAVGRDGEFHQYFNEEEEPVPSNLKRADLSGLTMPPESEEAMTLPARLFQGCTTLEAVQFPGGMTELSERIFCGCSSLSSVELPSTMEKVGERAFYGCSQLTAITIPASVQELETGAFQNCSSLSAITMPNKIAPAVMTIGESAFQDCSALETLVLPTGLETISARAFQNCGRLASVEFPRDLVSVEDRAFRRCASLTAVTIPPTDQFSLGSYAFEECASLASVHLQMSNAADFVLPEGVFRNCKVLSEVVLPNGVTEVQSYAFEGCSALVEIELPNRCTAIRPYAFLQCSSLRDFDVRSQGAVIESNAFSNCKGMTAAVIPENVVSIGANAFEHCTSIKKAVIPTTAEEVSGRAFAHCIALTDIYYADDRTNWTSKSFGADGSDLMNWINENGITLHLEWDYRNEPIDPMAGEPENPDSGGGSTQDRPVNPNDPPNLYGDGLPARITSVTVSGNTVSAKVLGEEEYFQGAALYAAAYGGTGLTALGVGAKDSSGTYQVNLDTTGAVYVRVFLLQDGRPVAERAQTFV